MKLYTPSQGCERRGGSDGGGRPPTQCAQPAMGLPGAEQSPAQHRTQHTARGRESRSPEEAVPAPSGLVHTLRYEGLQHAVPELQAGTHPAGTQPIPLAAGKGSLAGPEAGPRHPAGTRLGRQLMLWMEGDVLTSRVAVHAFQQPWVATNTQRDRTHLLYTSYGSAALAGITAPFWVGNPVTAIIVSSS